MTFDKPIVFLDIESTGLDVQNDRIIELAMIKYDPTTKNAEEKLRRFNPGIPIPKESSDLHGISFEDVKELHGFKTYAVGILAFIDGCDLCGFNIVNYDGPLLNNEFKRAGLEWNYTAHRIFDAGVIFKRQYPRDLTAAFNFYCNKELIDAHGALPDTRATMEVFLAQVVDHFTLGDGGKMTADDLELYCNYDVKRADLSGVFYIKDEQYYFARKIWEAPKDSLAKEHKRVLEWMLKKEFAFDTKQVVYAVLYQLSGK